MTTYKEMRLKCKGVVLSYAKYILIRVPVNTFKNYLAMQTHVITKNNTNSESLNYRNHAFND